MENFSISPLASGSKGNSYLITAGKTNILLDLGISFKALKEALISFGISPEDLSAVVVTHEHSDHTKGLGACIRSAKVPTYASLKTWRAMYNSLGDISDEFIKVIKENEPFYINDVKICPFNINHDAIDPKGYCFYFKDKKISAVTDSGMIDNTILNFVLGSNIALIEANYDKNLLDMGKYPLSLKQRISSNWGHLSNEDAASFSLKLAKSGTKIILLGHLSEENNYPDLAFLTVKEKLGASLKFLPEIYVVPQKSEHKSFLAEI